MPRKVNLNPPPYNSSDLNSREWLDWFSTVHRRVGEASFSIQGYSVSGLPSASSAGSITSTDPFSSLLFVYDETGGPTLAFSDGTNWLRVQDRTIVS